MYWFYVTLDIHMINFLIFKVRILFLLVYIRFLTFTIDVKFFDFSSPR